MKTVFLALSVLVSVSSFASHCESVDLMFKKYDVGLVSELDLADTINCNLQKVTTAKTLCNTKIGLKRDQVDGKIRMYNVGLITRSELDRAQDDLIEAINSCN